MLALICLSQDKANDPLPARARERLLVRDSQVLVETLSPDLVRLKGVLMAALGDPRFTAMILAGDVPWRLQEGLVQQVHSLLERRLDTFPSMAQQILLQAVGPDALFHWSCAGALRGRLIVAVPGPHLETLLDKLILPEWDRLLEWAG